MEHCVTSDWNAHPVSLAKVLKHGFLHGVPSGPKRMYIGDFPSKYVWTCTCCDKCLTLSDTHGLDHTLFDITSKSDVPH